MLLYLISLTNTLMIFGLCVSVSRTKSSWIHVILLKWYDHKREGKHCKYKTVKTHRAEIVWKSRSDLIWISSNVTFMCPSDFIGFVLQSPNVPNCLIPHSHIHRTSSSLTSSFPPVNTGQFLPVRGHVVYGDCRFWKNSAQPNEMTPDPIDLSAARPDLKRPEYN